MDISLDRAIEIMETEEKDTFVGSEDEWKAAVKVSYEAMKRFRDAYIARTSILPVLLPGEKREKEVS